MINTLIISCMDYRLNGRIEECNKGNVIILRNAGGDAGALRYSIEDIVSQYPIKSIRVILHADCGGMGIALGIFKEHESASKQVADRFSRFKSAVLESASRKELETEKNPELQRSSLKKFEDRGIKIEIEIAKVPEKTHEDRMLVVGEPLTERYEDLRKRFGDSLSNAYFIHSNELKEIMPDIEVAVTKMGLTRIGALSISESDIDKIKTEEFVKNSGASISLLAQRQNKSVSY